MKRFIACMIFASVVMCSSSIADQIDLPDQATKGVWIGVGPGGEVFTTGTFRFVFIPADPNQSIAETKITVGGDNPPPPPPPSDFGKQVQESLAKVTDSGKLATAKGLADAYQVMIDSVKKGEITEVKQLHTAVKMMTTLVTMGKAGWEPFLQLMDTTLVSCDDVTKCASLVETAIAELRKVK